MRQLRHSPLFILRSVFCIALAVMLSFAETVSGAVLYVKADATGAANGSSWTDAYTTISSAISAAADCDTIYVAKGVYVEKLTISKSLTIYGGFPGLSMDETLADRDPEAYQAVVTPSTSAQSSAVWQHVEPDMDNYNFTTANTTTPLIAEDGTVHLPAFTGDYDSWASSTPVSATMISINGAYTNRMDSRCMGGLPARIPGRGRIQVVLSRDAAFAPGQYFCDVACMVGNGVVGCYAFTDQIKAAFAFQVGPESVFGWSRLPLTSAVMHVRQEWAVEERV